MKWQTHFFSELSSTQDWLKQRTELPEGTCIIARRQSAGMGRMKRYWHSEPGGLYVSFLLKPQRILPHLPWCLWWACLKTLEQQSSLTCQLKAPNDILWQGRKLAGMLIDSQIQGLRPSYYICGVGFNLNQQALSMPACSLWQLTQKIWPVQDFLRAFQTCFSELYALLNSSEFESVLLDALGERLVQISYNEARDIPFKEYWHEHHQ